MSKDRPLQPSLFDPEDNPPQAIPAPPPVPSTEPPDRAAREQALDVHTSFIVEAPAGSGKTGLLVQRYLKLLADDSVSEPEQVLAITFTVKATAEMRDRVIQHLEGTRDNVTVESDFGRLTRSLAQAVLERDRQFGWELLAHPNRLNIRTIDSVCAQIARTLPVLSGSGGRLSAVQDAQPLYHEAARGTLMLLGTSRSNPVLDAAISDLLLHRDGNLADCESLLVDMLAVRDQWGNLIPLHATQLDDAFLDANVLPRLQRALEQAICTTLRRLELIFPPDLLTELSELAAEFGERDGYKGKPSPIQICAGRPDVPEAICAHLDRWRALIHLLMGAEDWRKERGLTGYNLKFDYDRKHHSHSRLSAILDQLSGRDDLLAALARVRMLPPAQYPANQWSVAKSLFRVLNRALLELQVVFGRGGQCDFTEFALLARVALEADSGPEDLASALGSHLQHLLVDEMQDTSASQYELLRLLTASWDGASQTVFLVGDPRQSIYLFRQARVESFLQTLETGYLGHLPLTNLRLTANFRSQQNLVVHFNHAFDLVFPANEAEPTPGSLPYSPSQPVLAPSSYADGLKWHPNPVEIRPALPLGAQVLTPAQLRQRQAKRNACEMRRIIERWLRKPLPSGRALLPSGKPVPWKIAVLVRNRSHLIEITSEFDKGRPDSVPYRSFEIVTLSDRQEVLDLMALTRALLHPADRVAALAVLRAPWCGLTLADLHTLTGSDDPKFKRHSIFRLIAERAQFLSADAQQRLARVSTHLEAARSHRARLTTAQVVERTWRSLGGDTWLGKTELTNARLFFRLLDEIDTEAAASGTPFDFTQLKDRMRRLYSDPGIPKDAPFPYVELLTMHTAKGLEWDVVLVPALERRSGSNRSRLLTWSELEDADDESGAAPILMAPIAAKGEEVDDLTAWIKDIYKRREAAERKRLFYVAATRAREELHLFAAPDLTSRGILNPGTDSLLKSAWAAAQPSFDALDQARARVVGFPPRPAQQEPPSASEDDSAGLDLAASAPAVRPPLQRLPLEFDPAARVATARDRKLSYGDAVDLSASDDELFARPQGSVAARSFGNVVHICLERLAHRILDLGDTPAALLAELPSWSPRIAAILRSDSLPRATVDRLTREALDALSRTLRDPDGAWLLASHPGGDAEFALTTWTASRQATAARVESVRVDRVFRAGPAPHAPGEDHLWIVDYKTSGHGSAGLDAFLAKQRDEYSPQLETYAGILAPLRSMPPDKVRLALYFPAIPKLVWWAPSP